MDDLPYHLAFIAKLSTLMTILATFMDYLKATPFYILPHHTISRLVYRLTRKPSKHVPTIIRRFAKLFDVNLNEAQLPNPETYETFNAFFTRALKPELRPITAGKASIASPVDGTVSEVGAINKGQLIQAKGRYYTVEELLAGTPKTAALFQQGQFTTLYLSPRDYHRIHMPLHGDLKEQIYIPGRLFSVAGHTVRTVPKVFARNERVVALFDTEYGKLAMVLVGAMNVAAIETVWAGLITPPHRKQVTQTRYSGISLEKGEEMGRFNMGSTVILLFERSDIAWETFFKVHASVRMGQAIGEFTQ